MIEGTSSGNVLMKSYRVFVKEEVTINHNNSNGKSQATKATFMSAIPSVSGFDYSVRAYKKAHILGLMR
jgi:hypothetical protein